MGWLAVLAAHAIGIETSGPYWGYTLLPPALFLMLKDGLSGGRSPGKIVMRISLVRKSDGLPCGLGRSFVRNLFLADFLLTFVAVLDWMIWMDSTQRLGDVVASTTVITRAEDASDR